MSKPALHPAVTAHFSQLGRTGGLVTAGRMTAEERTERARKAAKASALVRAKKLSSLVSALAGAVKDKA